MDKAYVLLKAQIDQIGHPVDINLLKEIQFGEMLNGCGTVDHRVDIVFRQTLNTLFISNISVDDHDPFLKPILFNIIKVVEVGLP